MKLTDQELGMMTETAGYRQRIKWWMIVVCASAASGGLAAQQVSAADWKPNRTVELITTAAAGGNLDIAARAIQKIWRDQKGGPFAEVVNKPGGAGAVAGAYLSQHAGNPHMLLTFSMTLFTSQITGTSNFQRTDVSPICLLFGQYVYLSVRKDSPIKDGKDFIDRLRRDPSSLSIAVATAIGNSIHMGVAIPMKAAGVDVRKMRVVAFKSSGQSVTQLLGGHVDVVASTFGTVLPHLDAGRIRVIGFSGSERLPGALAAVPTWREQGADASFSNWLGIVGAKGLDPAQVSYWERTFAAMAGSEEWRDDLNRNFRVNSYLNSREAQRFFDAQYVEIREILTDLGLAKRTN
ncbi:MAG: tripartite tricarboxylate transporter substrate binding protein [Burkholderiales bacterium]|nr:tripartite tricarboxylate transporter substrate binding protein [Burkholderiales bacterium]